VVVSDLGGAVLRSARAHPDRPALAAAGTTWTYRDLIGAASTVAAAVRRVDEGGAALCAVHAERSPWAYAGILGGLLAGRGYVPLNPSFPPDRSRAMLDRSEASTVVVDAERLEPTGAVLDGVERPITVIAPDAGTPPTWAHGSRHRVLTAADLRGGGAPTADGAEPASTAYLLFTSGTTGTPKGIGITQANVGAYLAAMGERLGLGDVDRCTQNFALTFDLSVHDMFACWTAGACLCVPAPTEVIAPARFVREQRVTCWFSTPSTAGIMLRLRLLRPGAFPTLRWSLVCGEALAGEVAERWADAAPRSLVENLYGPTEATIACTRYRYRRGTPPEELPNGLVPIGRPFGSTRAEVVGADLEPLGPGMVGELLLAGDQVAPGYWRDPERTARAFVSPPTLAGGPWYRTGDLASRSDDGELAYHGRVDDQIKIRGHRVELQEVEAVVRAVSGGAAIVVALGYPRTTAGADGVIVFTAGATASDDMMLEACRRAMPGYMVPSEIHRVESVPQNASGKVDRRRLLELRERHG
jgi:amino acid adenylation domain-containing protein